MHPMMAAINEKIKKAAAFKKAISKASVSTDGVSTVSTVLWESRADVDDWAGSDDDRRMKAVEGGAAAVDSMQVVVEAIEETDLREATGCGALPTDGGVWRQLEQELECARSEQAEQVLLGEGCSWEKTRGEDWEGSSEGSLEEFTVRSDGGFEATRPAEAEGDGDVWGAATVTAAAPADTAGTASFQVLRMMLGPRRGSTKTLGRMRRQSAGRPGPMWAASIETRYVS